eukprot:1157420-Pelagomonas_calceolata.AAC.4
MESYLWIPQLMKCSSDLHIDASSSHTPLARQKSAQQLLSGHILPLSRQRSAQQPLSGHILPLPALCPAIHLFHSSRSTHAVMSHDVPKEWERGWETNNSFDSHNKVRACIARVSLQRVWRGLLVGCEDTVLATSLCQPDSRLLNNLQALSTVSTHTSLQKAFSLSLSLSLSVCVSLFPAFSLLLSPPLFSPYRYPRANRASKCLACLQSSGQQCLNAMASISSSMITSKVLKATQSLSLLKRRGILLPASSPQTPVHLTRRPEGSLVAFQQGCATMATVGHERASNPQELGAS